MGKYTILLVDDDPFILKGIGTFLKNQDYDVTTASSGEMACDILEDEKFDLIITDLSMGDIDGIQVLKKAKTLNSLTKVIIFTGVGDMNSAIEALRLDADDYMLKPCEPPEIHFRVLRCFEKLEMCRKINQYENILPICSVCHKIRDDEGKEHGKGDWVSLEQYMVTKAGLKPSHTYCPECYQQALNNMDKYLSKGQKDLC